MITWNSKTYQNRWGELEYLDYNFNENKNMQSGVFTLSWINFKSAVVSGLITGIIGIGLYVVGVGDLWKVDFHSLINIGSISAISAIVSLVKNFLSTNSGSVAGIQVVDKSLS